jgi:hypothetical protein
MSARQTTFVIGLICIVQLLAQLAVGASPIWENAFPTTSAPERVYFRAHYLDGRGQTHELQVWRDGDRRLRRRTDDAIDLYVDRDKAGELDFRIVDHRRRVVIRADRTSLHRVGRFTSWIGLAHVLDVPHGTYIVTTLSDTPGSPSPFDECAWFRLETGVPSPGVNDICWSSKWGLPLAIETASSTERLTQFSIDEVRAFEADHNAFAVDTSKFIEIDARLDDGLFD